MLRSVAHPVRPSRSAAPTSAGLPRRAGTWLAALILAVAAALVPACARTEAVADPATARAGVTHVRIDGPLDSGTLALVARALRSARSAGHRTVVFDMNTPGGGLDVLEQIQARLTEAEAAGLQLVTWVNLHVTSAGALVALSCTRVYVREGATIGSSQPVERDLFGIVELDPGVREKVMSHVRSMFASAAEKHGRPASIAEGMVDASVEVVQVRVDGELRLVTRAEANSAREAGHAYEYVRTIKPEGQIANLTAREAVEFGIADGKAETIEQVLDKLGLRASETTVARLERANSETFVAWLQAWSPLLLVAGLVLAYLELKLPGFGLPGILSIACFALLLAGQYLAGLADVPHIVAVAVGVGLIVVEVFLMPGTLWPGIVGMVLVLGGLVLGSLGPGFDLSSPLDQRLVVGVVSRILLSAAGALVCALVLARWLPKAPVARRMVLAPSPDVAAFGGALPESSGDLAARATVGAPGRAVSDLRPVGKVTLDASGGHEWEARSNGALVARGARVRVVEVNGGRLVVERAEEGT